MNKTLCVVGALFAITASEAFPAGGESGEIELTPYLGVGFPDSYGGVHPSTGPVLGVRAGYGITKSFSGEFSYQRLLTDTSLRSSAFIDGYRINALWNLVPGSSVRPFLTTGIAFEHLGLGMGSDETSVAANFGLGMKWFLAEHVGVRFDARYIPTYVSGSLQEWENSFDITFGLMFLIPTASTPSPQAPTPTPSPAPTPTS